MQLWAMIVIFLAMLASVGRVGAGEHYKVFILAGQSNMDGRGKITELTGELAKWKAKQQDVIIAYSNSTIRGPYTSSGWKPLEPGYSVAPGTREKLGKDYKLPGPTFGPEVSLGSTLADGMPGKHVAILKFSEGGTNLNRDWNPDNDKGIYKQFVAFVRASLKSLEDRGDSYELSAVVWHQGESDSSLPEGKYQDILTSFIARVRSDLGKKDLPFVIGEVYDNGKRNRVRAGQRATAKAVDHVTFVAVDGILTSDQGTHFDTPGQIELGRRLADGFLKAERRP